MYRTAIPGFVHGSICTLLKGRAIRHAGVGSTSVLVLLCPLGMLLVLSETHVKCIEERHACFVCLCICEADFRYRVPSVYRLAIVVSHSRMRHARAEAIR